MSKYGGFILYRPVIGSFETSTSLISPGQSLLLCARLFAWSVCRLSVLCAITVNSNCNVVCRYLCPTLRHRSKQCTAVLCQFYYLHTTTTGCARCSPKRWPPFRCTIIFAHMTVNYLLYLFGVERVNAINRAPLSTESQPNPQLKKRKSNPH